MMEVLTERAWTEAHRLVESRGHVCVRALALGRCGTNWLGKGPRPGCSAIGGRVFDHASMYNRDGRPAAIVGHEYQQDADRLRDWLARLDQWPQLGLWIDGESWHYPGGTFRVVLFNREVWGAAA